MEFNFKLVERREDRLSSEYLDRLVADYRGGLPGSAEALLTAFSPLIGKYFRLLTATGGGFDRLDSLQRAILKYIYHDGLGDAVAAKKLHISVRSLRRRKSEAKKILRGHFNISRGELENE